MPIATSHLIDAHSVQTTADWRRTDMRLIILRTFSKLPKSVASPSIADAVVINGYRMEPTTEYALELSYDSLWFDD